MSTDITKAAEKLAKLRAQAEKVAGPLAEAEDQLRAAEQAEATRQAERGLEFDRRRLDTYETESDTLMVTDEDHRAHLRALLMDEPWFMAIVEFRASRFKRAEIHDAARSAAHRLGEDVRVPDVPWRDSRFLEFIVDESDRLAREMGQEFAQARGQERDDYMKASE